MDNFGTRPPIKDTIGTTLWFELEHIFQDG